jgi:tetratricopeptide (TPR) repeat protein
LFCPKCGVENPEDSLFCSKCGAKLSVTNEETKTNVFTEIVNKLKTFLNKKNIIIICSAIAIILAGAVYLNNPVSKFKSDIRSNNYVEANQLYRDKIKGNTDKEGTIISFLKDETKKLKESFLNKESNYDETKKQLVTIRNTGLVTAEANDVINFVNDLNNSRLAYKKAEEYMKNNDMVNALKEYKKVIEDDQNYEKAKQQISSNEKEYKEYALKAAEDSANAKDYDKSIQLLREAVSILPNDSDLIARLTVYEKQQQEKLVANQLVKVESAKIVVQDTEYKALYPDMIQVIVTNASDKTIKNMNVGCLGYDKNGYPLKVKPQFAFSGGDYEFIGNASDVNIVPGSRFGDNVGWSLDETHGIAKVLACVKSATFYDGTTWDNPYYEYWIEQYKEKPFN